MHLAFISFYWFICIHFLYVFTWFSWFYLLFLLSHLLPFHYFCLFPLYSAFLTVLLSFYCYLIFCLLFFFLSFWLSAYISLTTFCQLYEMKWNFLFPAYLHFEFLHYHTSGITPDGSVLPFINLRILLRPRRSKNADTHLFGNVLYFGTDRHQLYTQQVPTFPTGNLLVSMVHAWIASILASCDYLCSQVPEGYSRKRKEANIYMIRSELDFSLKVEVKESSSV
jgi:hypothetical protein